MAIVALPAAPALTPLNCSVPELLPTNRTFLPPEQPEQLATAAPPASVLADDSASYVVVAARTERATTALVASDASVARPAMITRFLRIALQSLGNLTVNRPAG